MNISSTELADKLDLIEELNKTATIPFLSANIIYSQGSEPVFKPFTKVRIGKYTVGLVGVCDRTNRFWWTSDRRKVVVADPAAAAKPFVEALAKETDLVVLLAHVKYRKIGSLASSLPQVDLIIGADGYTSTYQIMEFEGVPVCYSGRQGKNVGILSVSMKHEGGVEKADYALVNLKARMPEDPDIKALVDEAKRKMAAASSSAEAERLSQINADYIGYGRCRACHRDAYDVWAKSKHYTAFDPIISARKATETECLQCHTTGYGDGGFVEVRVTPRMVHVQCEACHGPGRQHAASSNNAAMPDTPGKATCLRCHDKSNSPNFDFDAYWAKIKH